MLPSSISEPKVDTNRNHEAPRSWVTAAGVVPVTSAAEIPLPGDTGLALTPVAAES